MSRNGSGTYTLPSGNPVVSGTLIEATWANTTLSDIASSLTDSLSRSGQGGMTAALRLFDGTSSVPGLAWGSETTTGFYRAGAGDTRLVVTGSQVMQFLSTGVAITGTMTTTGNVGIGTSSPAQRLDVRDGNIRIGGSVNGKLLGFNGSGTQVFDFGVGSATGVSTDVGLVNLAAGSVVWGTNGIERARIDVAGNLGLGVTPSAWSGMTAMDFPATGAIGAFTGGGNNMQMLSNAFWNGSTFIYKASGLATRYRQLNGAHEFHTAPSGTAGNAISFTQAMTLSAAGDLGIGTTSIAAAASRRGMVLRGNSNGAELIVQSTTATDGTSDGFALIAAGSDAYIYNRLSGGFMAFATSNTERARITSGGDLLVGTTSTTNSARFACNNTAGTRKWGFGTSGSGTPFYVIDDATGSGVQLTAGATSWSAFSDERIKTSVVPFANAIEKITTLRAGTGRYLTDAENVSRSFLIAQDVQVVLPEAVDVSEDEQGTLTLRYTDLIPLLTAAIQEQQALIQTLTARVTALESN